MNEQSLISRLHAVRDDYLDTVGDTDFLSTSIPVRSLSDARGPFGGPRLALSMSAAVVVAAAAAVVGVTASGGHQGGSGQAGGQPALASSVVASSSTLVHPGHSCAPLNAPGGTGIHAKHLGGPDPNAPAWDRPDAAFYATLPTDPAALVRTLLADATAEENYRARVGDGGGDTSVANLSYLVLTSLGGFLTDSAFPRDLQPVAAAALQRMAQTPVDKVEIVHVNQGAGGCTGTEYTARAFDGERLHGPVFDDGAFLGLDYTMH